MGDLHRAISSNQGTEVLPIGTELSTTYGADTESPISVKFHIVNWRYAEKEDGSKVWGCDLLATSVLVPASVSFFDDSTTSDGWADSQLRILCNHEVILSAFPADFSKYLQTVKVTSSITKDTPIYTYDTMWLPSATEMYIDTTKIIPYGFTQIAEGNDNEKYWKDVMKVSSKFDINYLANEKLQSADVAYPYWLRSSAFSVAPALPNDYTYTYKDNIYYIDENGRIQATNGREEKASVRLMCFFA